MRKPFAILLTLALLAASALAERNTAKIEFNNATYRFRYEGAEIVDGELTVKAHSDDGLPLIGSVPRIPALAVAEIAGERVMPHNVNVKIDSQQADYTYTFESDALPDAVWLYPDGKEEGALLLWQTDAPAGDGVEKSAKGDVAAIPEELPGFWQGVGTPKNGGPEIALTASINTDGTGEYTFYQADYVESHPFTLASAGNRFCVNIPADNRLGIVRCEGVWALEEDVLQLDITTTFASGGSYSYTAECTKIEEEAAEEDEDTPGVMPIEAPASQPTLTPDLEMPPEPPGPTLTPEPAPADEEELSQMKRLDDVLEALGDDVYRTTWEAIMADGVIGRGSQGETVKGLQQTLIAFGQTISADGSAGPMTFAALNTVQAAFGLAQTQEVGAEEYAQLLPRLLLYEDSDAAYRTLYAQYDGSGEYEYMAACAAALQGRFATAKTAFEHCAWGDWQARAEECVRPWPRTGVLYHNPDVKGGSARLTVELNGDPDEAMLVKIYTANDVLARTLFIGGSGRATTRLPVGAYTIRDGRGRSWYGEEETFGSEGYYETMTFGEDERRLELKKGTTATITVNAREADANAGRVGADREAWSDF